MPFFSFTVKGNINAESLKEAIDILEMLMDEQGIKKIKINISDDMETVTT